MQHWPFIHSGRFRPLSGVFWLALALVLAGCGDDSSDEASASGTDSTVTEPADPEAEADSDEGSSVDEEGSAGGTELGEFEAFADGTYTIDQLGVPVTFTVTGQWSTQPVGPGFFVISTPDSVGPGDHDIVALALPSDDLAGWLAGVPDTATMSEPATGEIGGFPTTVFTIDVGEETPCLVEDRFRCVDFALVGDFGKSFDRGFVYEVHSVEHPEGPIAFVIGTPSDDLAWLDTARAVVGTITFG